VTGEALRSRGRRKTELATAPKLVSAPQRDQQSRMCERHYSPTELAQLWSLSTDTVRRIFENEPGVLVFENPVRSSSRRFRTLRIPTSIAERVYSRFSNYGVGSRIRP
jgi:hypothetical protein